MYAKLYGTEENDDAIYMTERVFCIAVHSAVQLYHVRIMFSVTWQSGQSNNTDNHEGAWQDNVCYPLNNPHPRLQLLAKSNVLHIIV